MGFADEFNKACGIQGILALALVGAYIAAPFMDVVLPEGFTEITTFVCGFFFAKNGVPLIRAGVAKVTNR